jgi:hypothetical protein
MKPDETPPLSGFARDLLHAERRRPPPSARQRRSLWQRARGSLVGAGLLAPALWSATPTAAAGLSKLSIVAACAAVVGAGAGAVATVRWAEGRHARGARTTPAAEAASVSAPAPASAVRPDVQAVPAAPEPRPQPRQHRTREQTLIDQARAALARGDLDAAQRALDRHAHHFNQGLFRQEREALAVLVLLRAGRIAEAQAAATTFERRYPNSVFLPLLTNARAR